MKFEKPSRIQAMTLPMILTPALQESHRTGALLVA